MCGYTRIGLDTTGEVEGTDGEETLNEAEEAKDASQEEEKARAYEEKEEGSGSSVDQTDIACPDHHSNASCIASCNLVISLILKTVVE